MQREMNTTSNVWRTYSVHDTRIGAVHTVRMHHICSISHCLNQVDVFECEFCGNASAAGEKLRLDNMNVISLLRRLSRTHIPFFMHAFVSNYMRSQYLQCR